MNIILLKYVLKVFKILFIFLLFFFRIFIVVVGLVKNEYLIFFFWFLVNVLFLLLLSFVIFVRFKGLSNEVFFCSCILNCKCIFCEIFNLYLRYIFVFLWIFLILLIGIFKSIIVLDLDKEEILVVKLMFFFVLLLVYCNVFLDLLF